MGVVHLISDGCVIKSALISPCGRYRYRLSRRWGEGGVLLFVMLNPSTADADKDDPTIRRCVNLARSWGHSALVVANVYGYRATKPADLVAAAEAGEDTYGPGNLASLQQVLRADLVVAAWGANLTHDRIPGTIQKAVAKNGGHGVLFHHVGRTQGGIPRHPLYVKASTRPTQWKFVTGAAHVLTYLHAPEACEGQTCVIHGPHTPWRVPFRTSWRADRHFMERVCTEHGVGHPDPDDPFADPVHGCDGCCG